MNTFNPLRRAFIIIGNSAIAMPESDTRTCQEWCRDDLNLRGTNFENLIRGYMLEGKIQLFQGTDYAPASDATYMVINACRVLYGKLYEDEEHEVYNGVLPTETGEEWKPIFRYNEDAGDWELA